MSGDKINIRANTWYKLNGPNAGTPARGMGGKANWGKFRGLEIQQSRVLTPGAEKMLAQQTDSYTSNTKPKAYLNWILFDEQFKNGELAG